VSGSNDPLDKYNVDYPDSSTTYNVNDGFDHTVPEIDGEEYYVRVDALVHQNRRGVTERYPRSEGPSDTAVTLLPAPDNLNTTVNDG
jgi:hypothetical protein